MSAVLDTEFAILQAWRESLTLKRTSLGVPLSNVMTTDPFSISILSAGRGWLVVEKPSGLSIQEKQGQGLLFRPSVSDQYRPGPQEQDRL